MSSLPSTYSLKAEHERLIGNISKYSDLPDQTGMAIRDFLGLVKFHTDKEERIMMPIIGPLEEFAVCVTKNKKFVGLDELARLYESLLQEQPGLYKDHLELKRILQVASKKLDRDRYPQLVSVFRAIATHNKEEQGLVYPSALIVGIFAKFLQTSGSRKTEWRMPSEVRNAARKMSNKLLSDRVLTVRQEQIAKSALELGYFDYPKQIRLEELSQELGISTGNLSEVLRRVQKNTLLRYFGEQHTAEGSTSTS